MSQQSIAGKSTRYGTVSERADGYQIQFERQLRHPMERVWSALTDPAQLAEWLAPGTLDLVLGGKVYLAFTDGDGVMDGEVTALDPPRLLEFTWTDAGRDFGVIRWELAEESGGTRLALLHTVPESARDHGLPMLAGWHTLLEKLDYVLADEPVGTPPNRWQELHDEYSAASAMGVGAVSAH